jgi:nucleotide-binding universal stress UspA family protein
MFTSILVPLDGSPLAEQALPLAVELAKRAKGTLRLARAHGRTSASKALTPEDHDARRAEQNYLDVMAWRLRESTGLHVTGQLLSGAAADALDEHALAAKAGVIVLTTHGRGSLSRFWLGSVADDLLRRSPVPLLVYHSEEPARFSAKAPWSVRRILVPLDEAGLGEGALAPITELARLFGAELELLRVVEAVPVLTQRGGADLPASLEGPAIDAPVAQARADLDRAIEAFRAAGLPVTARVVLREQAVAGILEAAASADLVALPTRRLGRLARFFLGGVADKVVRAAPCPVFVARCHTAKGGPP